MAIAVWKCCDLTGKLDFSLELAIKSGAALAAEVQRGSLAIA